MKFKTGNFIDEKSLTRDEAEEFLVFLKSELHRHKMHMNQYLKRAVSEHESTFVRILSQTVVVRNLEDIIHTKQTLKILKERYGV